MTQLDLFAEPVVNDSLTTHRQPLEELGPFMQYMVTEHPDSEHGKAWREGLRRVSGQWVAS